MSDNSSKLPERSGKTNELLVWLREFFSQFQLAWRLFWDDRVPFSTKLVPLLTLFYLVMPVDLVPDAFLGIGQVDDLVLLLVGLRVFISLCPLALVDEHRQAFTPKQDLDELVPEGVTIIDLEPEESESTTSQPE
ncbi:MAG: DUF1232 domain-containing protein [Anaerolineae bacterium]|nr:DUF1232 domain-containing protein [Anaerolineae bacterium]